MSINLWIDDIQKILETYGWKFMGITLLLYVIYQQYQKFSLYRHYQHTLLAANDPDRVALFQRETARVRHKQQQELETKLLTKTKKRA